MAFALVVVVVGVEVIDGVERCRLLVVMLRMMVLLLLLLLLLELVEAGLEVALWLRLRLRRPPEGRRRPRLPSRPEKVPQRAKEAALGVARHRDHQQHQDGGQRRQRGQLHLQFGHQTST